MPTQSTSPPYRSPPTAGLLSIVSPLLAVKAPLSVPRATPLFCTTSQRASFSRFGSTRVAAVAAWAAITRVLPRTRIAGLITAFTAVAVTTASLAGLITTHPLPSTGGCTCPRTTDNGVTWTGETQVTNTFIRNVQITGDPTNGDVYVAGMDEGGGGFPHNDVNKIYRSTDGGVTFTNTYTGPTFPGPGVGAVGYFAVMFSDGGGYWRHEGWGEPAAYNQVVHLVYDQHGTGSDPADVYYIRSTDRGVTFSTPVKLNSDSTTRPNWQPNISVSNAGTLLATWYDARESASCTRGNP